MADAYTKVQVEEVEMRERKGGGPGSRDLSGAIGAETMTLRFWKFGPGDQMAYHRHQEQEEIYGLLFGGPQEMLIEGEVVIVNDGDWIRVPRDTVRRIQNNSDRESNWLIMGAPPGTGITDGIRINPETGEEIPRP
ncbi:MAG: cupin domain-containing protein [Actinomycetota bacterium]|nr:cupin domain-containing protein [Actinomycetota bacterium]